MLRLALVTIVLLLIGCSSQERGARRAFDRFLDAKSADEIRASIFLPAGIDPATGDRLIKQCLAVKNHLKTSPRVQAVEIRGRWAKAELDIIPPEELSLIALNVDGDWRVYWDPAGVLSWGVQKWPGSLSKPLSKSDWDDFHAITKKREEQAAPSGGDQPSH